MGLFKGKAPGSSEGYPAEGLGESELLPVIADETGPFGSEGQADEMENRSNQMGVLKNA
jgi:hypothetical protein